jgi:hypothetical protein
MMHQRGGRRVFTEMGGHPEINGCCLTIRPDISTPLLGLSPFPFPHSLRSLSIEKFN